MSLILLFCPALYAERDVTWYGVVCAGHLSWLCPCQLLLYLLTDLYFISDVSSTATKCNPVAATAKKIYFPEAKPMIVNNIESPVFQVYISRSVSGTVLETSCLEARIGGICVLRGRRYHFEIQDQNFTFLLVFGL